MIPIRWSDGVYYPVTPSCIAYQIFFRWRMISHAVQHAAAGTPPHAHWRRYARYVAAAQGLRSQKAQDPGAEGAAAAAIVFGAADRDFSRQPEGGGQAGRGKPLRRPGHQRGDATQQQRRSG